MLDRDGGPFFRRQLDRKPNRGRLYASAQVAELGHGFRRRGASRTHASVNLAIAISASRSTTRARPRSP